MTTSTMYSELSKSGLALAGNCPFPWQHIPQVAAHQLAQGVPLGNDTLIWPHFRG